MGQIHTDGSNGEMCSAWGLKDVRVLLCNCPLKAMVTV